MCLVFFALLAVGAVLVLRFGAGIFLAYVAVLGALMILVCAKKGEPPR